MRSRRAGSTQSMVRGAIRAADRPLRPVEIRDLIGLSGERGYSRVSRCVKDLLRSGEIERHAPGRYVWKGERPASKVAPRQNTVWRFCQIRTRKNRPFSLRDVVEVTGVAHDTAKKYITFLKKSGQLVEVGKTRHGPAPTPMYLLSSDAVNGSAPVMRKNRQVVETEARLANIKRLAMRFMQVGDTRPGTLEDLSRTCDAIKAELFDLRITISGAKVA